MQSDRKLKSIKKMKDFQKKAKIPVKEIKISLMDLLRANCLKLN
jgi:hypothetical protein